MDLKKYNALTSLLLAIIVGFGLTACSFQPKLPPLANDAVIEIAKELSIPIEEEILSSILSNNSLKSDYIHPNAEGYRRLAESIATLLHKSGAI